MKETVRKRSIGITALLSATIAGLTILSVGLVLALSTYTAWQNTFELLRARSGLAVTLIEDEIRNHINPAMEISHYLQTQVATGQVDPEVPGELVTAFKGALAAAPQIAGVVFWDENNIKIQVGRNADGVAEIDHTQDPLTPELLDFIERSRRQSTPAWGEPSEGDAESNYVYTTASLDHRGRHWGVMATGVTIKNLSAIVKRIGDQLGMTAFILHDNHMLAHPALDALPVAVGDDNLARLRTIAELNDPVVAQFYQSEAFNPPDQNFEFRAITDDADEEHFVLSRSVDDIGDTPWHIGIYGPAETLGAQFRRLIYSLVAGVLVLVLAIACAFWIARKISRPIRKLADSAEQIGMLKLANAGDIAPSGIKELDEQAGAFNRMVDGLKWFETYVPKRLVRRLIHSGGGDSLDSHEVELSVMFTDIIGFTALSETMPPGAVGDMLNEHFEILSRCIEAQGGTLDKYIGDAVMAFWGAPEAQPDHAQRACRAALAIADELAQSPHTAAHGSPMRIKIAIHSGPLLVGNIGASSRMNYTVIGDTVNTCSRIESLCAKFDDGESAVILVSSDTAHLAQSDSGLRFEEVGGYEVKGRSGEVHVCRLRAAEG